MSGALAFGAAIGGSNPASVAILGAFSGITAIINEKDQDGESDVDLSEIGLSNMLSDTCDGAKGRIEDILQAVTGYPGSSEADIPHEMKMQNGEGKGYEHAISYLFGDGQWLVDHPTEGLAENFDKVKDQWVGTR